MESTAAPTEPTVTQATPTFLVARTVSYYVYTNNSPAALSQSLALIEVLM